MRKSLLMFFALLLVTLTSFGTPTTWYVDPSGTNDGSHGTATGSGAFLTIQYAIDAASAGDMIKVYPGSYNETAPNSSFNGATYQFGLFFSASKSNITLQGCKADGTAVTNTVDIAAFITTNATNTFGYSGTFVVGNNITLRGLEFGSNSAGDDKAIEVLGNGLTFDACKITANAPIYIGDYYYSDNGTPSDFSDDVSSIQSYTITNCHFAGITSTGGVYIANGAGWTGSNTASVTGRSITGCTFDGMTTLSFAGLSPGFGWLLYPTGAATVTGNTFTNAANTRYIQSWGVVQAQFPYASYYNDNTFPKKTITTSDGNANNVRGYDATSAYLNLKRIGTVIQPRIDNAQAGDVILVGAGTYDISGVLNITKGITLKGANAGVAGTGTRGAESILSDTRTPSTNSGAITIGTTAAVVLDGFKFEGSKIITGQPANVNLTLQNNKVILQAMPNSGQTNSIFSTGCSINLNHNYFETTGYNASNSALLQVAGGYNGTGSSDMMTMSNNYFKGNPVFSPANGSTNGASTLQLNFAACQGTVSGNTFDGVDIGVILATKCGNFTVSNNTFKNQTRGSSEIAIGSYAAGIILDDPAFTGDVTISGNTFQDSDCGIRSMNDGNGLGTDGFGSYLHISGNTFTGNVYDIKHKYPSNSPITLDGDNTIAGTTITGATASQLFSIKDKIVDKINTPNYGLVLIKPSTIYMTTNSYCNISGGTTTAASIQRGIDAASSGWTVNVGAGTFNEQVNVNKSLTLLGAQANVTPVSGGRTGGETIIRGGTNSSVGVGYQYNEIDINADNAEVNGFELSSSRNYGITTNNGATGTHQNVKIKYNYIHSTDANFVGIALGLNVGTATFNNYELSHNYIAAGGAKCVGFSGGGSTAYNSLTFSYNDVSNTGSGCGIFVSSASFGSPVITYNNFHDITNNDGIHTVGVSNGDISHNTMSNCGGSGAWVSMTGGTFTYNTISNCLYCYTLYGNTYGAPTAANVEIAHNSFTYNDNALRSATLGLRIPSYTTTSDVNSASLYVHDNAFIDAAAGSSSGTYAIKNTASSTLTATCNWFGTTTNLASKINGSVTYIPYNVSDGGACSGYPVVVTHSDFSTNGYATIQSAINASSTVNGDVINVAAGTYNELVVVNKSVTLKGANAGVHPAVGTHPTATVGTRSAETILSHDGYYAISPAADNITIDGFKFTGQGGRLIDTYSDANGFHLTNCIFADNTVSSGTGMIQFGGGSHTNLVLDFNLFKDKSESTFYAGGGPFDNLTVQYNKFQSYGNAILWAASALSGGMIDHNEFDGESGANSNDINIGMAGNLQISYNWFHNIPYTAIQCGIISGSITGNKFDSYVGVNGLNSAAIHLWGGEWGTSVSTDVAISNNEFHYNQSAVGPVFGIRLRGPNSPSDPKIDGTTIHIHNNAFYDGGARGDAFAILDQGDATKSVDATCSWFASESTPLVYSAPSFTGPATYKPHLMSGTDASATIGFQTTESCSAPCALALSHASTAASCPSLNNGTASVSVTTGGSGNYSYLWSGGQTTSSISGLAVGSYTVTVTDLNGCSAIDGVNIPVSSGAPVHNANSGLYYCTIQAAINAATEGDEIDVNAGTYNENLTVDKRITLNGAGIASTTINSIASSTPVISVTGSGTDATHRLVISNLKATGANGADGIRVANSSSQGYLTFSYVNASSNTGGNGIHFGGTGAVTDAIVSHCITNSNGLAGIRIATACPSFDGLLVDYCQVNSNGLSGFSYNPSANLSNVGTNFTISNSSFSKNITAATDNNHDLSFFGFHGNATLTNVSIESGNGTSANGANYALLFTNASSFAVAGNITLNGVTITGYAGKGALSFQKYSSTSNVSLTDVDVSGCSAGWGQVIIDQSGTGTLSLGNTTFKTLVLWNTGNVDASISIIKNTSSGGALSRSSLADCFQMEDQIVHATDNAGLGLVRVKSGNIYVTTNSGSVQRGINAASTSDVVNVAAGTYNEEVVVNKPLTINGAKAGVPAKTLVSGLPTGAVRSGAESIFNSSYAMVITSSNVTIDGFKFIDYRYGINIQDAAGDGNSTSNVQIVNNILDSHKAWVGILLGESSGGTGAGSFSNILIENNIVNGDATQGGDPYMLDAIGFTNSFSSAGVTFDQIKIRKNDVNNLDYRYTIFYGGNPPEGLFTNSEIAFNYFHDAGGMNAGMCGNMIIHDNLCQDIDGYPFVVSLNGGSIYRNIMKRNTYYGIGLWGGEYNTLVSQNVNIYDNDITFNDIPALTGTYAHGIKIRTGVDASTIHIYHNKFTDGGQISGSYPIYLMDNTSTADAITNYFNTCPVFYGPVNFFPYYTTVSGVPGTFVFGGSTSNITAGATINPVCAGSSTTVYAMGGSDYSWDNSLGVGASHVVTPSTATTYNVTGKDGHGCTGAFASKAVTITTAPSVLIAGGAGPASANGSSAIAAGSSENLTASGTATTFVWSTASTANPISVSPSATTIYTVTGTLNGCSASATHTVYVASVSAGSNQTICNGSSATLTAISTGIPSPTYLWNFSPGATTATVTVSPGATTTYTVTVNGTFTSSVTVIVRPKPAVSAGAGINIAPGGSGTLTATTASTTVSPYSFAWSTTNGNITGGANTATATVNSAGTYTVVITDGYGCTNSANTTVVVLSNTYPVSGNVSYAFGTVNPQMHGVTITLQQGASTYTATTPATGNGNYQFNSIPAGTYTVTLSTTKAWGGVDANDVNLINSYLTNPALLAGIKRLAADVVDNSGSAIVLANDRDQVNSKRLNPTVVTFATGNWVFTKAGDISLNTYPIPYCNTLASSITLTVSGAVTQDFKSLCYGDVNASNTGAKDDEIAVNDVSGSNGLNLINYPNPFTGKTTIRYTVPADGSVSVKIYSTLGVPVATLTDPEVYPGTHTMIFDAQGLAPGVYPFTVKVTTGEDVIVQTGKMLIIK